LLDSQSRLYLQGGKDLILLQHSVLISKKVKRVSLHRYLLSKIAFGETIVFRDIGGLVLNQLWLENKAKRDKKFKEKFGTTLEVVSNILRQINMSRGVTQKSIASLRSKVLSNLEDFLIPRRNLAQWKMRFDSSVLLSRPKPSGVPIKELPAERYIGIGYRDKGTAKNTATDGSPSWQDIAQSNHSLNSKIEELFSELKTTSGIKEKAKIQSRICKLQKERGGVSSDD